MAIEEIRGKMSGIRLRRYSFDEYGPQFDNLMVRTFDTYKGQIQSNFDNLAELKDMIDALETTSKEMQLNGAAALELGEGENAQLNAELQAALDEIKDNSDAILCLAKTNTESCKHHIMAVANLADYAKNRWVGMVNGNGQEEFPNSVAGQEMIICNRDELLHSIDSAYEHYDLIWSEHDKSEYVVGLGGRDVFVPEPTQKEHDGKEDDRDYEG